MNVWNVRDITLRTRGTFWVSGHFVKNERNVWNEWNEALKTSGTIPFC